MTVNVFEFGNTYWVQKDGTAMGTPCACNYATIVFAYYERTSIIPQFKNNLLLYLRYIDDIFIVWKDLKSDPDAFERFKNELDIQCNLKWVTEDKSYKTNFLDLTIEIDRYTNSFTTRTYQKASNLFLYIPAHSAHPPGLIKGLVYGFLETYWRQNTFRSDYIKMVKLLFQRLLNRGYEDKIITPIFNEAALKIEAKFNFILDKTIQPLQSGNRIFFHLEYHKRDVSRQCIRDAYESTCESLDTKGHSFKYHPTPDGNNMMIKRATIAYSRPKNLRDQLISSKLFETDSCNAETILQKMRPPHGQAS